MSASFLQLHKIENNKRCVNIKNKLNFPYVASLFMNVQILKIYPIKTPLKVCKVLVLLTRKYLRLQENTREKFFKFVTNRECLFKFSWGICDYI